MLSLKALLIPTILSLAVTATADCPKDWYENTSRGETKCCFGHMMIEDRDAFCCIHDLAEEYQKPRPTDWSQAGLCLEKVPFTATDYSSRVSSASEKATDALYSITASNVEASATSEPSAAGATSTDMTSGSGSECGASAGSETSTTPNAAMPAVTAGGMVIGGAAVAVILAL